MDKKKLTFILYVACAVVWSIRAVLEIVYKTYNESVFWFIMNVLCAVIWIAAAIVQYKRCSSDKENDE